MLQQNHDDIGNLWIIIKQVRKSYLIGYDDPKCQKDNQIAKNDIQKNIDNVAKNLAISSMDYDFHENITEDILQAGAEMFTYLNFCPPKKLIKFYKEILIQGSTKVIILAMTNIMKTRKNAEKSTATEIWSKIENNMKFLKYKKINSITLRQMNHLTEFANCINQSCSEELEGSNIQK